MMQRVLTTVVIALALAAPASAQTAMIGVPPSSLAPPVIVFPASAINGSGTAIVVPITIPVNGIATTSTDALLLQNTTASTVGTTVQMSPRARWCGSAWNSVGVASETDCFFAEVLPATVAGTTTATWQLGSTIAGGAATYPFTVTNAGVAALTTALTVGTNPASAGTIRVLTGFTLKARNTANNGDITILTMDGNDNAQVSTTLDLLGNNLINVATLKFLGVTSSFPALKRNATTLEVRLADDSAYAPLAASGYKLGTVVAVSGTAPTVTSAGTSPSITASNGTAAFRVNVGTGGTATTIVLAMPAATTGWNCWGQNLTAAAANRAAGVLVQQSSTTAAATLQWQTVATGVALAFAASDIVAVNCMAF